MTIAESMTTWSNTTLLHLQLSYDPQSIQETLFPCSLQWRRGQLWVRRSQRTQRDNSISLESQAWLVTCLNHSSANLICLDSRLEESTLQFWVNICEKAKKQAFLRFNVKPRSDRKLPLFTWIAQAANRLVAISFLVLFSPILLSIILLMFFYSSDPILCKEWRVGMRGKLFQTFQFKTHRQPRSLNAVSLPKTDILGKGLRRSQLYQLPQLFNVLQGEMALMGRKAWTLKEIDHLTKKELQQVNIQPGILWI